MENKAFKEEYIKSKNMNDKKKLEGACRLFYKAIQRSIENFYAAIKYIDWDTLIFYDAVRKVKEKYGDKENKEKNTRSKR